MEKHYDVFISYSKCDEKYKDQVVQYLEDHGISCWYMTGSIDAGDKWRSEVSKGIRNARCFVMIHSSHSSKSEEVPKEVTLASERGIPKIPFKIDDAEYGDDVAYELSSLQAINAFAIGMPAACEELRQTVEKIKAGNVEPDYSGHEMSRIDPGPLQLKPTYSHQDSPAPRRGRSHAIYLVVLIAAICAIVAVISMSTGKSDDSAGTDDAEMVSAEEEIEVEEVEEAGEVVVEAGEEEAELEEETEVVEETAVAEEDSDITSNIPDGAIEYDGHYYLCVEKADVSWDDAEELCEAAGGHLMTINSSEEQEFLEINLSTSDDCWWIGACYDTSGIWSWVTGEPMSYSNWTLPSRSTSTSYRYMGVWGSSWQYFNEEGEHEYYSYGYATVNIIGYICEWEAEESEEDSDNNDDAVSIPDDAIEYDGHSYRKYLTDDGFSWEQAEELCELLGGHLMTITSEEEQDFLEINLALTDADYWLGGYYDTSGTWVWVTGESMDFTDWVTEPTQETSSEYRYMGTWDFNWQYYDEEGKYHYYSFGNMVENISGYICEWDTTADAS